MAECPQCRSSIEITDANFGTLFNCPHCQAVFFVGWDGVPEQPQMQGAPSFEPQVTSHNTEVPVAPMETPADFSTGGMEPAAPSAWEPPAAAEISPQTFSNATTDFSDSIQPMSGVQVDPSPNFKDVVEFGNAPGLKSALTYTITVQGIEIADIREKFKEAISDARFGWDVDALLKQIKGGVITFPDLGPAKAAALINRIKYLPIRISWRQNALS